MLCTKCGAQIADDAKFCTSCGAPTENQPEQTEPAPEPMPNENEAEGMETPEASVPEPEPVPMPEPEPEPEPIPEPVNEPEPQSPFEPKPQTSFEQVPQPPFEPMPQTSFEQMPQPPFEPMPQYTQYTPVPPVPPMPPMPANPKKEKQPKKKKKGVGVFGRILSVFLCIILILFLILAEAMSIVAALVTEKSIDGIINKIDLCDIVVADDDGRDVRLPEFILGCVEDLKIEGLNDLDEDDIKAFLDSPVLKDSIIKVVNEYRAFFVDGKNGDGITSSKFFNFLEENEDEINRILSELGHESLEMPDRGDVDELFDDTALGDLSIREITDSVSNIVSLVRFLFSRIFLVILWLITALLALLIMVINRRQISSSLSYFGVALYIVGIIYCGVAIAAAVAKSITMSTLVSASLSVVILPVVIGGLSMLFAGTIMLIIKYIIKSVKAKRADA